MRWRRVAGSAAVATILAGAIGLATGELPRWTIGGMRMASPPALGPIPADHIVLPDRGTILFVGDSNTAGSRAGGLQFAYPAAFADIAQRQTVRIHAFGGATVGDMLSRRMPEGPIVLAFVMLGTNDAAPRGLLSPKRPVPLNVYRANLTKLVKRLRAKGARSVILAPPPLGSRAMQRRLDPYRYAARDVALETSSAFRDPSAAFQGSGSATMLQRDAVHLTPEAQHRLGVWLLHQITSASIAASSSTGKPSPASASQPS